MNEEPQYELALFPLNMVLFPLSRVQLHIFEQRYRKMIRHCRDNDLPFGIVMIRAGDEIGEEAEPYMVGTAVRILDVYHYQDGRMDITVQGTERFRIKKLDDSSVYLIGTVESIHDQPNPTIERDLASIAETARNYSDSYLRQLLEPSDFNVSVVFPEEPERLSFAIASMLDLPLIRKQALLETTDTCDRLEQLVAILEHILHRGLKAERRLNAQDLQEWASPN